MRLFTLVALAFLLAGCACKACVPCPQPVACAGDCNHDGAVNQNEVALVSAIANGDAGLMQCPEADENGDGRVTIDEVIDAAAASKNGCTH